METIHITNDFENKASADFFIGEYWLTMYGGHTDFDMMDELAASQQAYRDYFTQLYGKEIEWLITSVLRLNDADWSPHKNGSAVDSRSNDAILWKEILSIIRNEFKNWQTSPLVKAVLATGVNILLIENGCLHTSKRDINLHSTIEYGKIYIGEWSDDGSVYGANIAYSFNNAA